MGFPKTCFNVRNHHVQQFPANISIPTTYCQITCYMDLLLSNLLLLLLKPTLLPLQLPQSLHHLLLFLHLLLYKHSQHDRYLL